MLELLTKSMVFLATGIAAICNATWRQSRRKVYQTMVKQEVSLFDNFGSTMVEHQNESSQKFWFNNLIFMFLIFFLQKTLLILYWPEIYVPVGLVEMVSIN